MKLPYVIDNSEVTLAQVLNDLMSGRPDFSLDTATAYFNVGGFSLLKDGLDKLRSFRLLLGTSPDGEALGLIPKDRPVKGLLRNDLAALPFNEETLRLVEDMIAYLNRNNVQVRVFDKGFLHAKCWLFYGDKSDQPSLFDRFQPLMAIVGSSNFTRAGLTSNNELNLTHKVLLAPAESRDEDAARSVAWLAEDRPSERITDTNRQLIKSEVGARAVLELQRWYDGQWAASRDFKPELIELLDESKFGKKEYTPYQVYMKALYEYFRDELDTDASSNAIRSAVDLAEFQMDAVKKARTILNRYHGVMVADSVGLGKTWIGKKLLEDFAYHMRQKALVICPAGLKARVWEPEMKDASISASILTQEALGREDFETREYEDADVILIDESHNFRNKNSQRYENLEKIIGGLGGKGKQGGRKKIILLTATPINNDLLDLYNQINLITQGDRSYFAACGIGDLYKYFIKARQQRSSGLPPGAIEHDIRLPEGADLFNLLEEIVIRRTRPFIKAAYPDATIKGEKIIFPDRQLKTINYDLETTYKGIYKKVVKNIEALKLAPYHLEAYKKNKSEIDDMEAGRQIALVGIFKSRYLKRFESSIDAFRISLSRALSFFKTFEDYVLDGKLLKSSDFRSALRYLENEDNEDDARTSSMSDKLDKNESAKSFLEKLPAVDPSHYDLRKLHSDVQRDVEYLNELWNLVRDISPEQDAKLEQLKLLLSGDLKGKKVLVFSYFKDTARYIYENIWKSDSKSTQTFRDKLNGAIIRRMDSGSDAKERERIIQEFAPEANRRSDLVGTDKKIDILISTDVLSEGQNLQDCGIIVNYDLHWNPTRMVQRAGRIDRIGTKFSKLWIYNIFPEEGLEKLLKLVESLSSKIKGIDDYGLLDSSILGELVNPRTFNTLRRIKNEDGQVIEEEEQFMELVSHESLLQNLRSLLNSGGQEMLDTLPDGIHSGLVKPGAKGIYFYFQAKDSLAGKLNFWKYYDIKTGEILDNRFLIANMISCTNETPRVIDPILETRIFEIQESVIKDILRSHQQKIALEVAPRTIDPIQQNMITIIQGHINNPDILRSQALKVIGFLNLPKQQVQIKKLREIFKVFEQNGDMHEALESLSKMMPQEVESDTEERKLSNSAQLEREKLRLICFDYLS